MSSILIPAAVSSFFAGRVADLLGRPKNIAIGALIFGLGAALEAGANTIAMFIVGRVIEGAGEGLYLGTLIVQVTPHPLFCCDGLLFCFASRRTDSKAKHIATRADDEIVR